MNSNFWLVIATAAPVVVLTCIVLCSTQGGHLAQLFHEWKTKRHPVILTSIIVAAVVNLVVFSAEAIAFLDVLGHLEENTDGNTGLAISWQMWCLILLGVSSVVTHVARVHLVAGEGSGTEFSSAWRQHLPADHDQLTLKHQS